MYPPSVGEGEMRLNAANGDPAVIPTRILMILLSLATFVARPPAWAHLEIVARVSR